MSIAHEVRRQSKVMDLHAIPEHPSRFDPRGWHLLASLSLAAGCGSHQVAATESETSTSSSETSTSPSETSTDTGSESTDTSTDTTTETETGEPYECESYLDCPLYNGPCGGVCAPSYTPPPDCMDAPMSIPTVLEPGAPALALSFADVDADGQSELVVATATELLVYALGNDIPTVTPRAQASNDIETVVAGHFDDQPGDDLLLLVDGELHRYFADGIAGFVNPSIEPQGPTYPVRLISGDFDGQDPSDLLVRWNDDLRRLAGRRKSRVYAERRQRTA